MPHIAIFFLGLGCFILAAVGVILSRISRSDKKSR